MDITKIEKKEDVKKAIDTSTDYKELYENSIKVLKNMESNFKGTLNDIAKKEKWDEEKQDLIWRTRFDKVLDTDNPVTIFEKKGKDLIERSKDIAENSKLGKACIDLGKMVGIKRLDDRSKQVITDELRTTRTNAIQDFKKDISDGILSNYNNIKFSDAETVGIYGGNKLFSMWRYNPKEFEQKINDMSLLQLTYTTFHMYQGRFGYCYGKLKEKLGSKNLFDYIDSLKKPGDQTSEMLKYSALKMLFHQGNAKDLQNWLDTYRGKQDILKYIRKTLKNDENFKMEFLQGMKQLEKVPYFKTIADELKQQDSKVKQAYKEAVQFDNVDVFTSKKVNALAIYDNEGHGGGSAYFDSDLEGYKNQGFSVVSSDKKQKYTKYVLKKGVDKVTMIKVNNIDEVKAILSPIVKNENFNLFALRGHCYNTSEMALELGGLNAVDARDILIDGGCWNAQYVRDYRKAGLKGQIFAYTGTGKGASTQAFINKIIKEKSIGKKFSDMMDYYNNLDDLDNESTLDGYFAEYVERPDSVAYKYKVLTAQD